MTSRNDAGGGCLRGLLALVVIIAIAYGVSRCGGGDDDNDSSSASPSASASHEGSGAWEVGDCGGPDPDRAPDGYKRFGCDDSGATFKALKIEDASILPGAIQCPAGTDVIVEVSWSYGSDSDSSGGIPTDTVCGRNLSADHPGDAGAGGGQLVRGDCVDDQAQEIACAEAGATDLKVLALVDSGKADCPSATTTPMELTVVVGRPYDTICGGKV